MQEDKDNRKCGHVPKQIVTALFIQLSVSFFSAVADDDGNLFLSIFTEWKNAGKRNRSASTHAAGLARHTATYPKAGTSPSATPPLAIISNTPGKNGKLAVAKSLYRKADNVYECKRNVEQHIKPQKLLCKVEYLGLCAVYKQL